MSIWIRFILLLIALVAAAAGGTLIAALRSRSRAGEPRDRGLVAVAGAMLGVSALCSAAASGVTGVLAFAGVCVWASYIVAAQRFGLFSLKAPQREEAKLEEPRRRA